MLLPGVYILRRPDDTWGPYPGLIAVYFPCTVVSPPGSEEDETEVWFWSWRACIMWLKRKLISFSVNVDPLKVVWKTSS